MSDLSVSASGRKMLPGRSLLIGVAILAFIFLDFETISLSSYTNVDDGSSYDAQHRTVGLMIMQTYDNNDGKKTNNNIVMNEISSMQQKQLETQFHAYQTLVEHQQQQQQQQQNGTGPQEIVIDPEDMPDLSNKTLVNSTTTQHNSSDVEEITVDLNETLPHINGTRTTTMMTSFNFTQQGEEIMIDDKAPIGLNETPSATDVVLPISYAATTMNNPESAQKSLIEGEAKLDRTNCHAVNSPEWLKGPRVSNVNSLSHEEATEMILSTVDQEWLLNHDNNAWTRVTDSTICHDNSTFRTPTFRVDDRSSRERLLDEWHFRLTYWAIQAYHHTYAVQEADFRRNCRKETLKVPTYDYECKGAKFLVTAAQQLGVGASFRLAAVNSVLMGIATNRITVFVNNADGLQTKASYLREPWPLASCDRHDMQCVFLPTTPCSLLVRDLENATILPESAARGLRRQGVLSHEYENERILIVESRLNPPKRWNIQGRIKNHLFGMVAQLLNEVESKLDSDTMEMLREAAKRIHRDAGIRMLEDKDPSEGEVYDFSFRFTKMSHAALLYITRLLPKHQAWSNRRIRRILPLAFDPSTAIGMPIRGSDKCLSESICIGFDRYMLLMQKTWQENLGSAPSTKILLTTEDPTIQEARYNYTSNGSFPLSFIVNEKDTLQGTGSPKKFGDDGDKIVLDSIVSLKLQLHSKYIYGNCCSNFHLVLFDLMNEGCGLVQDPVVMCLQEHPDPQFHICCGWTKSDECNQIREAQWREKQLLEAGKAASEAVQSFITAEKKEIERLRQLNENTSTTTAIANHRED